MKGMFKPCKTCALCKAKAANVSKYLHEKPKVIVMQLFMDITSPIIVGLIGKKHLLFFVDDCSNYTDLFFEGKSDLPC